MFDFYALRWRSRDSARFSQCLGSRAPHSQICDFGLARVEEPDTSVAMTQEVVTQYYR